VTREGRRLVDPLVSVVREFARERAERSSLRILAPEMGLGHSTLHNFLSGADPHPRIWSKLREWYGHTITRSADNEPPKTDPLRRARERMRTLGPRALSASELVAVLLDGGLPGSGPGLDASAGLLREFSPSDAQALRRIMAAQLATVSLAQGLGAERAAVLLV
jgi:hypothetical protein